MASRLGPEQLGRLMFRQQCRAYSRAAGFRAICELLQAAEGWESLQARLLRTLRDVLRPPPEDGALTSHYTRDTTCAGPHASGRLRHRLAALPERLRARSPSTAAARRAHRRHAAADAAAAMPRGDVPQVPTTSR